MFKNWRKKSEMNLGKDGIAFLWPQLVLFLLEKLCDESPDSSHVPLLTHAASSRLP